MPPSILDRLVGIFANDGVPQEPKLEGEEGIPHHDEHDKAMAGRSMELDLYFSDMDGRLLRADTRADERAATPPPGSNGLQQHHHRSPSLFDTTPVGLDQFIALLPTVVRKCETRNLKKCEPVKALLKRLQISTEDVEKYAFWDPSKLYTRNLVATDGKNYTVLLLCWNPGRESPIHDHPCEGCWVKTVQGRVKETVYEQDSEGRGLVPVRENIFHPDELSYIEDSLGFHKVGNLDPEVKAMTLHVYIPPPKSCRIWLSNHTRLGEAMTVPVCYFSAYGRRIDHTATDATGPSLTGAGNPPPPESPAESP